MDKTTIQTTVKWPQIVAGLAASGGAFVLGISLGWPAPVGPKLTDGDEDYFPISKSQFDWTASIVTIGLAISCLPIGILMKKFGRKWTMISLVAPFMVGWVMVVWAQNFVMLLLGRLILGIAGGAFCVTAPQYAAEISEKEIRGIVGSFCVTMINGGILFVYIVGAFMSVFWMNVVCSIIPLVFGFIFVFMPESPVYQVTEKRDDDARKTYKWLRGDKYDPQNEIDELKQELEDNEINKVSFGEALKRRATQRALFIGFGSMFFQQLCGINAVIFYSTAIFTAADTGIDADFQTIIVGAVLLTACFAGGLLVDRLGRKSLLSMSSIFMTLMLVILGIYFYVLDNDPQAVGNLGWLPITSLCIYLIAYSIGYGPIPWLLISEVYPKDYNAIAGPLNGTFSHMLAFAVTSSFGSISDGIGIGPTFWIFAVFSLLGAFFSVYVVIETKAKSMVEIQRILAGEKIIK